MANIQAANGNTNSGLAGMQGVKTWKPLLVLSLFVVAVTLAGNLVFQRYKEDKKDEVQQELAAIAGLKSAQIKNWLDERRGDAQTLSNDPLFLATVERWLQQGAPSGADKTRLAERLSLVKKSYGYASVSLFDTQARLRLSSAAEEPAPQEMEKRRLLESMRNGQLGFSDIHLEMLGSGERVEIELRAPLLLSTKGATRTVGAVLFRIDPHQFIFPLIQNWPTPSPSAESMLVRRDGDEVLFLNELRFRHNAPLSMRLPLDNSLLLGARAVAGQDGLVEGVDYRNVPVIGVVGKVAGTSWFLISKVDKSEIYLPISRLAAWMVVLMLALIGMVSGLAIFWYNREKRQYVGELRRLALEKQLDYLARFANDIIFLLDDKGCLVNFNERAMEAFGYTASELTGMQLDKLRAIDFSQSPVERFRQIEAAGGALIFESMLVRRNGERFPVEVSVRQLDVGGRKYYQAITRDITERKRYENELVQQRKFIRQVIDSDPNFIFVKDAQGRFLLANEAIAKSWGLTTEELAGKFNSDFVRDPQLTEAYDSAVREVVETRRERVAIELAVLPDGEKRWFQTIRKPLEQADGSVSVLTIATDITLIKEKEVELQRLNRALRLLGLCNAALVHAEKEHRLLEDICRLIVEAGGYSLAWVGLAEHDAAKTVRIAAQYGSDNGYLENAGISWDDTERGNGPTGISIRTGITQINHDFASNPDVAPWREAALAQGFRSSIALSLADTKGVFGALVIYSAEVGIFRADEVRLLEELASDLAFGVTALRTRGERELAVEGLRLSEERFRFLAENASDMIYLMSTPGGNCTYVSPSSVRVTGYAPEEFYASPRLLQSIIHPDSRTYCEDQLERLQEGEHIAMFEFRIVHKNGQERWLQQRNAPVWKEGDGGTLVAIQGVVTDITEQKLAQEKLQFSNAILTTMQDASIDGMLVVDPEGKMISFNRQFVKMWGIPREVMESQSDERATQSVLGKLVDPDGFLKKLERLYERPDEKSRDEIHLLDGRVFERYSAPLVGAGKAHFGRAWYFRDITERKHAEEMLQEQRTFLHQIIDADPSMIYVKDSEGKFLLVNRALAKFYGLSVRQMKGAVGAVLGSGARGLSGFIAEDAEALRAGQQEMRAESMLMEDGEQRWFLTIKKALPQKDGSFNVLGMAVDITRQKLSESKLEESYSELQRLTAYLENAREDERKRIARELHDEMGATLAALKMRAAWLASKMPPDLPLLREEVEQISGLVSDGIATVREVVSKLRPTLLEDVGLEAAFENYVNKFRNTSGLECILALPGEELGVGEEQAAAIFRILQESLSNVAKHAEASKVSIRLARQAGALLMEVEDNGIGMVQRAGEGKTFGLIGIRERARMAGGHAEISSVPGKGARVSVTIPYSIAGGVRKKERRADTPATP